MNVAEKTKNQRVLVGNLEARRTSWVGNLERERKKNRGAGDARHVIAGR
jgi:hypothetical protein